MAIPNPFQMNDWGIKKLLAVVLGFQVMVWLVIGLDTIGFSIPFLRQVIPLIYLAFIPGILILRVLKLHRLGGVETLLYGIGLSLTTIIVAGLLINTALPSLGVTRPFSIIPLTVTMSVIVFLLAILSYVRDRAFNNPSYLDLKGYLSPAALLLYLLPLVSILGAQFVNRYVNNIILLILIVVLALLTIIAGSGKLFPKNLYPLVVFSFALTLLYHTSLISSYLWGWDIHVEYYLSNLVTQGGYWDSSIFNSFNSMLSIVIVAPVFSIFGGLDLTWVFKILYPLFFVLVAVGLYRAYERQTENPITTLLSCLFLIFLFNFYTEMVVLPRQEIAEYFLVLFILLLTEQAISNRIRTILSIIFAASLAVSHYGTSYVLIFSLILGWLVMVIATSSIGRKVWRWFLDRLRWTGARSPDIDTGLHKAPLRVLNLGFVLPLFVLVIAWYLYAGGSSVFTATVRIGDQIFTSLLSMVFNPQASGISFITGGAESPLHNVSRYLHFFFQFFIVVGGVFVILKIKELKFKSEYLAFSFANLVFLFFAVILPFFRTAFNTTRVYQLTLLFLAPFAIVGIITLFQPIAKLLKRPQFSFTAVSVLLAVFLLFNTGFLYEVAKDHPTSIALSQSTIKQYGDWRAKTDFYTNLTPVEEITAAQWLSANKNPWENVYATYNDIRIHALTSYGMIPVGKVFPIDWGTVSIENDAYIYLQYPNVIEGMGTSINAIAAADRVYDSFEMTRVSNLFEIKNLIYANGISEIYK